MDESGSRQFEAAIAMPTNMKRFEFHRRDLLRAVNSGSSRFFSSLSNRGIGTPEGDELAHDSWSSIPDLRPLARFLLRRRR
jgi:hypothetical protein